MTPLYLTQPETNPAHSHGTVVYDAKENEYVIRAEPAVLQMCKRLFPGSGHRRFKDCVKFKATRRATGELNWLLLRFPMTLDCGDRFDIDRAKAIDHAARRESATVLRRDAMPITFKGTPYPYQLEGVSFLTMNERGLLADDMGLGKTVTGLAALAQAEATPALIVVPCAVQRQWCDMADAWLQMPSGDLLQSQAAILKGQKTYEIPDTPLTVIHYGLLRHWRKALQERGYKAIIFDEVQELRHTGTEKYSAASILSQDVQYCWGLTGTPIYGYGSEIWAVLNAIDFQCLGDWESFSREWCTGYDTKIIADPKTLGDYLRREGLMLRRRKSEVQDQLPAKRRAVIDIDHDEDQYRKLIAQAVTIARGYDGIKEYIEKGKAAREAMEKARRAAGIAKAGYVADFAATLIDAGEKPIMFAWHHDVHDILAERLEKYRVVHITGRQTEAEKRQALATFKGGDADLCLLSLRSTAGLDGLQGVGTCVVFAELDWSPAVHSQCEDRLHRIGFEKDSLLCYYLVSNTSFDLTIQEVLGLKVGQFVSIMGDEHESAEAKQQAGEAAMSHIQAVIQRLKAA